MPAYGRRVPDLKIIYSFNERLVVIMYTGIGSILLSHLVEPMQSFILYCVFSGNSIIKPYIQNTHMRFTIHTLQCHYSGTSFIRTLINQTLHLLNLQDSQKLFRYSHVKFINMACNSSLSSDFAGIPSMKRKRKVVSIEKKPELCCRHEMGPSYTSVSKEYGLG